MTENRGQMTENPLAGAGRGQRAERGFTLIELLTAVSVFSVVAVSLYSVFHTGIFTWRRLNSATTAYQQARVALELMGNEIANYIPSKKIALKGDDKTISFLSVSDSEGQKDSLFRVSFLLDEPTNTLMRSQEELISVLNETPGNETSENIISEEFLPDLTALKFGYFCESSDPAKKGEYEWLDLLDPEAKSVPRAVSVSITQAGVNFTKIVPLYVEGQNEG